MDTRFMDRIENLRINLGFPFYVTSAFRCPEYNQQVSSTGPDGPHTTGHAMDIGVSGNKAWKLLQLAGTHGMTGIGVRQHGDYGGRFIHLDDLGSVYRGPRPHVWSYR